MILIPEDVIHFFVVDDSRIVLKQVKETSLKFLAIFYFTNCFMSLMQGFLVVFRVSFSGLGWCLSGASICALNSTFPTRHLTGT